MPISKSEYLLETKKLEDTISVIRRKISELGAELYEDEEHTTKVDFEYKIVNRIPYKIEKNY